MEEVNSIQPVDKVWSRAYPYCLRCQSKDNKHYAKGLCIKCYRSMRYAMYPDRQKLTNDKWRAKNPERWKELVREAVKRHRERNK